MFCLTINSNLFVNTKPNFCVHSFIFSVVLFGCIKAPHLIKAPRQNPVKPLLGPPLGGAFGPYLGARNVSGGSAIEYVNVRSLTLFHCDWHRAVSVVSETELRTSRCDKLLCDGICMRLTMKYNAKAK